jgi:hypothetical protein
VTPSLDRARRVNPVPGRSWLRLGFDLLVLVVFTAAALAALDFPRLAQYFPLYVGILGACLAAALFASDVRALLQQRKAEPGDGAAAQDPEQENEDAETRRVFHYSAWVVGFVLMLMALGMEAATWLYLYLFLTYEARVGPRFRLLGPTAALVLVFVIGTALPSVNWPDSVFVDS